MGNQKWGHSGFPSPPPHHLSPPSRRHRPCKASPQLTPCPGTNECPRPMPRHSLEAPRGEEEQLGGQRPRRARPDRGRRLLGAILGGLQLRDPVGEPPVCRVPGGWGDGREKAARQTHLPRSIQTRSSALDSGSHPPRPLALPTLPPPRVFPSARIFPGPVTLQLWGECDLESVGWEVSLGGRSEDDYRAHPPRPSPVTGTLRVRDVPLVPAAAHAW